jgi:DNA-binding NarL/FixJ family response regulator
VEVARKIRVFLVDDEPDACRLMRLILESEADMETAGSRTKVAGLLEDLAQHPTDVLLTDLTLKGEDAIAAIREVKLARPEIRIVVLSGCMDPEVLERAREAGAAVCVAKSFEIDATLQAIRNA